MAEWNRSPDDQSNGHLELLMSQLRNQSMASGSGASFSSVVAPQTPPAFAQPLQQHNQPHAFHQPPNSNTFPMPPSHSQNPVGSSSAVTSPIGGLQNPPPQTRSNSDRTNSLLNLLKFSQPATSLPVQVTPPAAFLQTLARDQPVTSPALKPHATGFLATLMGNSAKMGATYSTEENQPLAQLQIAAKNAVPEKDTATAGPSSDTQSFLLNLLNRPKPAQTDEEAVLDQSKTLMPSAGSSAPPNVIELTKALEDASIGKIPEHQPLRSQSAQKASQGLFTYTNPFDELAASSPRNRTPKSATPAKPASGTPSMQILKPPRHMAADSGDLKRKVEENTSAPSPAHSRRKLSPPVTSNSPKLPELPKIQPAIRTGSPRVSSIKGKETVSKALSDVGSQVDKQVEQAIARAEEDQVKARAEREARIEEDANQALIEKEMKNLMSAKTEPEFEVAAKAAAKTIKKELGKEENKRLLEDSLPAPVADAVQNLVDDAAQGHIADNWESADAEDSPEKNDREQIVKVFNFPMKPWISITLRAVGDDTLPQFRADSLIDIARLKKDFDQMDRTLSTASNTYIVYGVSKFGGFRVIRQSDGMDMKLFNEARDRIFNVSLSTSISESTETIIGTGISGTVYWATLVDANDAPVVENRNPEQFGFALPPFKASGEESSGGAVKTRARKSCSHPEFFAVGRGKSIHIVWPAVILHQGFLKDGPERTVDIEKYLSHRSLKINTGKAGKDFTFSQDDTTIVSLDKAGRVKFWDVRTLTHTDRGVETKYPTPEQIQPVEITEPLMTMVTTPANEKSWPTSVLFVDKLRPYQKGGALRYLVVGMKQNHILQLWDLALRKPVQELHLPHDKESDGVCSVMYHASTGMIVVGHPTRNSIYFIHLSSPRYNLPKSLSQAEFVERLVAGDTTLPKPEATAVMSGIREFSLANRGTLRSLDILASPSTAAQNVNDPALFELYAVHSKGVTCISVRREDLGWNKDNRVLFPVNAEEANLITVEAIKSISSTEVESSAASPAPKSIATRPAPKETPVKETGRKAISSNGHPEQPHTPQASGSSEPALRTVKPDASQISTVNGGQESASSGAEKQDKRKKKKSASSTRSVPETSIAVASTSAKSIAPALPRVPSPPETSHTKDATKVAGQNTGKNASVAKSVAEVISTSEAPIARPAAGLSQASVDTIIKKMEGTISSEMSRHLDTTLETLYRRFDEDRRTQAAVADAKQDAMLRLISSTLTDNVDKALANIVQSNLKKIVLPAISDVAKEAVNEQLGSKLATELKGVLPKELQSVLPDVISKTLQKPEVLKLMSESLARSVAFRVEEQFASLLKNSITPGFTNLAFQAVQQATNDIRHQAKEVIGGFEQERHNDSIKIDQLSMLVRGLSETVSTMAAAQSKFQGEFLKLQQAAHAHLSSDAGVSQRGNDARPQPSRGPLVPEQADDLQSLIFVIDEAIRDGQTDSAVMHWIQSNCVQELFDQYFAKYDPVMMKDVNPLGLLSIGATIASMLEGQLLFERLNWTDAILQSFQSPSVILSEDVRSIVPKIIGSICAHLEHLFMRVNQVHPQDPLLKRISNMILMSKRIIEAGRPDHGSQGQHSFAGRNPS